MQFFSKIMEALTPKIKRLEGQAHDVLELPKDLKALRVDDDIFVIDSVKNKIIKEFPDTFPSNPARATFQLMKKLKLSSYDDYRSSIDKKSGKEIWTCGFRDSEDRWVWYKNAEPQMTVSFDEVYLDNDLSKTVDLENKIEFCSAKYGTQIINTIKQNGLEKTSKEINALILDNPYTQIECPECKTTENYTIDDFVDGGKKAKYDSNLILCSNCNKLIKLM